MPGLVLSQLRSELRIHLGLDSVDLSNTDADILLNRGYWELQGKLKLPQNNIQDSFSTVAGTSHYAITYPDVAIITVALKKDDVWTRLDPTDESTYINERDEKTESRDIPTRYLIIGTNLILDPIPNDVYTIQVTRHEVLTDLSDSNPNFALDIVLNEVLLLLAVYNGFIRKRDFNSAYRINAIIDDKLSTYVPKEVREQESWKYAQVQIIRPPY